MIDFGVALAKFHMYFDKIVLEKAASSVKINWLINQLKITDTKCNSSEMWPIKRI